MVSDFRKRRNECGCEASTQPAAWAHAGNRTRLLRNDFRTYSRRAVEIAFNHENGYIIVEVIAAKICCGVIDAGHEVFGGQRRTTAHCRGKALHAEFFVKPVLSLSDAIGIENQHVIGGKVNTGPLAKLALRYSEGGATRAQTREPAPL